MLEPLPSSLPALGMPFSVPYQGFRGAKYTQFLIFCAARSPGRASIPPRLSGRRSKRVTGSTNAANTWNLCADSFFGRGDCHNKLELIPGFGTGSCGVTLPEEPGMAGSSLFLSGIPAPPPQIWEYPQDSGHAGS